MSSPTGNGLDTTRNEDYHTPTMKTLIRRTLIAGLLLGLALPSHARQPRPTPTVAVVAKGRVLVFKTERTLSGEIELHCLPDPGVIHP